MQNNSTVFQILGIDPNWICVLYDLLRFNYGQQVLLDVFPNIDVEVKAEDRVKSISFDVKPMQTIISSRPSIFGVGSPRHKYRVYRDFSNYLEDEHYANLISNSSIVSHSTQLGKALLIDHQCAISSQTSIGFGVSIKRGAKIGHHNTIGDFVDINPGVVTAGNVHISRGCEIGSGSIFNNNVTVGENTFIGSGSVVTKSIPANCIAYGNPCKVVRPNDIWSI